METTLFRWIHLSDIHVGHGDAEHGWDQKLVMDVLRQDIATQVKKEQAPIDAILVTGDIAFSGAGKSSTEYAEARDWLLAVAVDAGVTARQIFVIPGNHDVNRNVGGEETKLLLESLRSDEKKKKLDTALGDAGHRRLLAERMAAYLDFSNDFAPACLRPFAERTERLFWRHTETRAGVRVVLAGLNTALLAADDKDYGKLQLGKEQLNRVLLQPGIEEVSKRKFPTSLGPRKLEEVILRSTIEAAIQEGDLVMVLTHHPLRSGWLADEKDADAFIRNHTHVHLSGHVHEADSEQARSGAGGTFLRVVAGSVHGDQGAPPSHGYSFGAVVRSGDQLKLRVWPRKWSAQNASFRLDVNNVPDGKTCAEHDLRVKLPPEPRSSSQDSVTNITPATLTKAPDPVLSAQDPTEIFISYAPEDEPYLKEIEKRLKTLKREKLITSWSAAQVGVGEDVKQVSAAHLRSAKVVLLLVSPDYLSSDELYDGELQIAVERHEQGQARIVPILVRACDYTRAPFARLRMVPPYPGHPEKPEPVKSFKDTDTAYLQIQQAIAAAVQSVRKGNVGQ